MSLRSSGAKRPLRRRSAATTSATSNGAAPVDAQPNGTMATGTASSADLVISMTSCALAAAANHDSAKQTNTANVFFISYSSMEPIYIEMSGKPTRQPAPGLKLNVISGLNSRGLGGAGKGDALITAFSTDCLT